MPPNFDDDDEPDDERAELIEQLLRTSARWLLEDPDPQAYIERLVLQGPRLFGALLDDPSASSAHSAPSAPTAPDKQLQQQFFRSFGWAIASAMPLPTQGFVARKLPLPGRNEPCLCRSGRKFKHCCSPAYEGVPAFHPEQLGAFMVLGMSRKAWAGLPATRVSPHSVLLAAMTLRDEAEDRAALALLEPWARQPAPWPAPWAPLLDLLCDTYLDEGHPIKRRKLAQAMVDKGEVPVRSTGWRRLSMMASDAGDSDGARHAFEMAQRLTPDEPDVALLEVTTLLGSHQRERAAERAAFHARRLARLPHAAALADEIEMLEAFGRGEFPPIPGLDDDDDQDEDDSDSDFLAALGDHPEARDLAPLLRPDSPFQQMQRWAEALPAPQLRLRLDGATQQDLGELAPAAAMAAPLARWRKAFPLQAPTGAWGSVGPEAIEIFVDEKWSDLLVREPRLADCFEVLDGLVLVLDLVPMGLATVLQVRLMQRALALWAALRERYPQARCEWGHMGNRPALRLLAHRVGMDESLLAAESLPWLRALVEVLNPHDNHGFRERLAAVYLRRSEAAAALALCERYPGDFVGLQLLHALALLATQQLPQAAAMLKVALAANTHVRALLLARRAPKAPNVPSYAVGSAEEARVAVTAQHDLWRAPLVQQWLQLQLQPPDAVAPGQTKRLFD